jgi:F5/8 type C domain
MTRLATLSLCTLLFGCGTTQIQDEEGKNDWVEVSRSAENVDAVVITASKTYLNNTPSLVADGNVTTSWNAGDYPPQWIRFDLGAPHDLVHVRLLVKQVPHTGVTDHRVYGSYNGTKYTLLGGFSDTTRNSQWLQLDTPARGIRYIKVETTKSPSWVGWSEIQVNGSRSPSTAPIDPECPGLYAGHTLKKFGYWGGSFRPYGDRTPQMAYHSNLTFIQDAAWNMPAVAGLHPSRDVTRLQRAESLGVKGVLVLRGLFFHDTTGELLPNYRANWNTYAAAVAPEKANIAAFYPIDEPVPTPEMRNALDSVNAAISAKFPNIPIAVIFNHAQVRPNLVIPAGFDWVGFDCYGDWDNCAGHSIPWYLSTLKSRLTTGQKLFLVPDVAIPAAKPELGGKAPRLQQQFIIVNRLDRYYALALNEPRVIGLVPFMWQRKPGNPNTNPPQWDWWGADSMQIIREKSEDIGRCITGKL